MIEVSHLTKKYGPATAVDDISFTVNPGEIVGLLGPNGAGKSTTLRMLTCYLTPTSGVVKVDGFDTTQDSLSVRKRLGYLSENAPLYEEMNVWEFLEFAAEMQGVGKQEKRGKIERVLDLCALQDRARQDISELSKGYRQRVGLAQSLIHDPAILILDEPTTGLDPNQRVEIRDLIKNIGKQKTIILSSHVLSEVEATCDRVLIINKGKIVASGTPAELRASSSGQVRLYLKVEGDGGQLRQLLERFSGVHAVLEMKTAGAIQDVMLALQPAVDIRKKLAKFLVEGNFGLLELYQEEQSLEDIFVQLTKQ